MHLFRKCNLGNSSRKLQFRTGFGAVHTYHSDDEHDEESVAHGDQGHGEGGKDLLGGPAVCYNNDNFLSVISIAWAY
jgi:hypothetical protein